MAEQRLPEPKVLPGLAPSMLVLPAIRSIFEALPAWLSILRGPVEPTQEDFESGRWARGLMASAYVFWPGDCRAPSTAYAVEMQMIWEAVCDDPARIRWEDD